MPTKIIRIEISKKFAQYLESSYSIGNRWTLCNQLLDDFNFVKEKHINEYDYCSIANESFKLRLTSHRRTKYLDKKLILEFIKLKPKLSIQLTVKSQKKIKVD